MANLVTETSSLFMLSSDALGSELLSKKFRTLLRNDKIISESFFNDIGIWKCTWYYDSSVRGYNIGDAVWYNTESVNDFVIAFHDTIKNYTDLNSMILKKLPEWSNTDNSVVDQYLNALTGYQDKSLGRNVVLPPIFDIGDIEKPIEIYVSTKNNNKDLLSNRDSWKRVFVDNDDDLVKIDNIISSNISKRLKRHLKEYHFLGKEEKVLAQLSDYLDFPSEDEEEFHYDSLSSSWYINANSLTSNRVDSVVGMDYVLYFVKKPYVLDDKVSQYQAMRLWKSGKLEHFGTIAKDNQLFRVLSNDILYCRIPFDWKFTGDGSGAKAFIDGEIGIPLLNTVISAKENETYNLSPIDNLINVRYEKQNVAIEGNRTKAFSFLNGDYTVSMFPVYQDQVGIDDNYIPVNYDATPLVQNWNSNFLTNELLDVSKDRHCIQFRQDLRIVAPYISYYAVGLKGEED